MSQEEALLVSRERRIGRIRLNRPKALNSLTLDMVRRFKQALDDFVADPDTVAVLVTGEGERGLCAGGDIRALYECRNNGKEHYKTFWREEYALNARIASFSKPYVVLMDGIVMGGGVGVSAHGNRRVATEHTQLAMPETRIGFIPDVGGTWLLARGAGAGVYMALSGVAVGAADAMHVGLCDQMVQSSRIPELVEKLAFASSGDQIDATLAAFAIEPEKGELQQRKEELDRVTAADSVEHILENLRASGSAFGSKAAKEICRNSPSSLKVTYALLKRARTAERLETCLISEYRAACSLLDGHDLYEGIRAALIDKDKTPRWRPPSLEEVDENAIKKILEGRGDPEPDFGAPPQ
ncbi:3-hydroxyisobutyryl-CoA hydrolase [Methylocystis sp. MJC1]|jgi:enoyl-CoA hydratase|uniref:3-hydroxyisobutyryl-CoA hydrolase n=1 Tax=Methylocystis sp. MJC1 TaxID=2654282 RepID=UPI0013EAC59A|nr:3-hydroxyisobutyryl-CoA hydrolase [Methylocystis sp. MJC1]KAF2989839.1 Short-chain-enoyl-CoA hydratase [Methylocystis sp. MJC1]MBU6528394.1 enoyl-CoA hydratase/isomerase family protein [Methylocystis sp. MJC1]UZX11295.1 3-hydroxyisobutyryl-CoA hydrolase [Methylocystis sp. MJC1]